MIYVVNNIESLKKKNAIFERTAGGERMRMRMRI